MQYNDKFIPKFMWKNKCARIARKHRKRKATGGCLPDFKTANIASVIKAVQY